MGRGPKKHLKRLNAPSKWMLQKLDGKYASKPSSGPHKERECIPLIVVLRNKLKYALTRRESMMICKQRLVRVDNRVRTDMNFPTGFQDVISLPKAKSAYRVLFDTKGRYVLQKVQGKAATWKLARVMRVTTTARGVPALITHDGRTVRYPDPSIKTNDTVRISLKTNKVTEFYKFQIGATVMVTRGRNAGRCGSVLSVEQHPGSFDMVTVRDAAGNEFVTRLRNTFVLGGADGSVVALPRGFGVRETIVQTRNRMLSGRQ